MNYKRLFIENAYVFITIVTYKRQKILIENIDLLRQSFAECKKHYNFDILAIVVLSDHLHMIIKPSEISEYPKIIGHIKKHFTKNSNIEYKTNKNRESTIWQRRYWEHTIQNENDLFRHLDYIHFNPVKHNYVENVKDWEYSSFNKFVEAGHYDLNWCNIEDTHKILNLDIE